MANGLKDTLNRFWFGDDKKSFSNAFNKALYSFIWVKYVHRLQNLYFALTGEELTLKN